nr:MAG TPA: hypothetical protein [Inoviridae sp.]
MKIEVSEQIKSLFDRAEALQNRFAGIKFISQDTAEEQQALLGVITEHNAVMSELGLIFYNVYLSSKQ